MVSVSFGAAGEEDQAIRASEVCLWFLTSSFVCLFVCLFNGGLGDKVIKCILQRRVLFSLVLSTLMINDNGKKYNGNYDN